MRHNLLTELKDDDTAVHCNPEIEFDLATPVFSDDELTIENQNETELYEEWEFSLQIGFLLLLYVHL